MTHFISHKSMLRCFLLAFFIAGVFMPQAFTQTKKYPSLLWEISGNGLEEPSYIYGTMHVSRKIAFHLSDTFFMGIKNADIIGLETDPDSWLEEYLGYDLMKVNSGYRFSNGYSYRPSSPTGMYKYIFPFDAPSRTSIGKALAYENTMMNGMLYRYSRGNEDFEESTFLDLYIYQAAKKQGKQVVGLEDFRETRLLVSRSTLYTKADKNRKRKYGYGYKSYGNYQKINDAYRKGDLDLLDSLMRESDPTVNYRKYMLDIRNRNMVERMDSLLATKVLFVGVGCAHLPGDSGMIEMLRAKGYKLRPVDRTVTKESRKKMKDLQKLKVPVEFSMQHSEDGMYSLLLPGKMYEVPSYSIGSTFFYPEMTNGAAYTIRRIKTYGAFFNKTPEQYLASIDSMLYENIPGDIINLEEIEIDGYKGFDIYNVNRRGDEQRYRILVTPFEILLFKVKNTGPFSKSNKKEINKMMESIHISQAEKGWKEYKGPWGEYTLKMPKYALINNGLPWKKESSFYEIQAIDIEDNSFYMFNNYRLQSFSYIEQDSFELNMFVDRFKQEMDLEIKERKKAIYKGYPMVDVTYLNKDKEEIKARFILHGLEYYMLLAKGGSEEGVQEFFESLAFIPYTYQNPSVRKTDSVMLFTVDVPDGVADDSYRSTLQWIRYKAHIDYSDNDEDERYDEDDKYSVIISTNTNEKALVHAYRYGMFDNYDSLQHFYKFNALDVLDYKEWYEIKKDTFIQNGMRYMDILYGDSASSRALFSRLILNHAMLYTITTMTDTNHQQSDFVKAIYASFKPFRDTVVGSSVFESKIDLWYSYIMGEDSLKRAWAISATEDLMINDEDVPKLIDVYQNFSYDEDTEGLKEDLIDALSFNEHKIYLDFLIKAYKDEEESTDLKYEIMAQIGEVETKEAYEFIAKEMTYEPPLSNEKDAWELFGSFVDSFELCVHLYPEFFELAQYPEYEGPVHHMLQLILDSGVVSHDLYAHKVNLWASKALNELRRFNANKDERRYGYPYRYYNSSFYSEIEDRSDLFKSFEYHPNHVKVLDYAKLLTPYKDNKKVQKFIEKSLLVEDESLLIDLLVHYQRKGIQIHDSIPEKLMKNCELRYKYFKALRKVDALEHFDSLYLNHDSLIVSKLYNEPYDSIVLLKKKYMENKVGKGYVYIYKYKVTNESEEEYWRLAYAYLVPKDSNDFDYEDVYFSRSYTKFYVKDNDDIEEDIEEEIQNIMFRARCKKRERASSYSSYGYNYYLNVAF